MMTAFAACLPHPSLRATLTHRDVANAAVPPATPWMGGVGKTPGAFSTTPHGWGEVEKCREHFREREPPPEGEGYKEGIAVRLLH